jgi:polar amino acid transport system substrate-binding protein
MDSAFATLGQHRRWTWVGLACALAMHVAQAGGDCPRLRAALLPGPGLFELRADGSAAGMDVEVARELSHRTGCPIDIEPTNVTRLWRSLELGAVDLTSGAVYSEARADQADFLVLTRVRGLALTSRALAEHVPDREAFAQRTELRLGVIAQARRPASVQAWIDRLKAQGRVSESGDLTGLLKAYAAGRVAAVWIPPEVLVGRTDAWLHQQRLLDWFPDESFLVGWAVSKRVPDPVRRSLRSAADAAHRDGTLARMAQRHLGPIVSRHVAVVAVPATVVVDPTTPTR